MLEANLDRIRKDMEAISVFTATPGEGMTRFSYTEEDRKTREYIESRMMEAGLEVYEDAVGNIFGRREGKDPGAPSILVGSHFDSVKHGGFFDGPAGVVTGLEIARILHERNIQTNHPIEFAALIGEEGARFGGGLFGSRAMAGLATRKQLEGFKDTEGVSISQAMEQFGLDPERFGEAVRNPEDIKAFIELHIEQGPVLEAEGYDVGIVETIVSIGHYEVEICGRPDHAGTTPMNRRADSLTAAAEVFTELERLAGSYGEGTVGTVGRVEVLPGCANIVPGKVVFTLDIRSIETDFVRDIVKKVQIFLKELETRRNVKAFLTEKVFVPAVPMDRELQSLFFDEAEKRNIKARRMTSGAGHDAMIMAGITKAGLLFIPCREGRSHCTEEWTETSQIKKGVDVILGTLLRFAGA